MFNTCGAIPMKCFFLSLFLAAAAPAAAAQFPPQVADVPTSAPKEFQQEYSKLMGQGPHLVAELVPHLKTEKDEADAKSRFVISGLVWHTGKHGSADQKKALGGALLRHVPQAAGDMPKNFLLEQLQYVSDPAFADKIAEYIKEEALANQALRTLVVTSPDDLERRLLAAMPVAPPRTQVGILLALVNLQPRSSAAEIAKLVDSDNPDIQAAAVSALAATGDPAIAEKLKVASAKLEGFHGSVGPATQLAYANALASNGQKAEAVAACREVLSAPDTRENAHLQSAALDTLVAIEGDAALPTLLQAADSDHEEVRVPALRLASRIRGEDAVAQMIAKIKSAPAPEVAADAVLELGSMSGDAVLPTLYEALKSEEAAVRVAAVKALGNADRTAALPNLIEALKINDRPLADAIGEQLARTNEAKLHGLLAPAIEGAATEGKVMLIDQIARRKFSDLKQSVYTLTTAQEAPVRTAAYKALETLSEPADFPRLLEMMLTAEKAADRNAARRAYVATARLLPEGAERTRTLIEKFSTASPAQQIALLETFPLIGGEAALKVVVQAAAGEAEERRDAAVRALSEWPEAAAIPELQNLLEEGAPEKHRVLAIRGIIRLAGTMKDEGKKLALLKETLKAAQRPDDQKLVIAGLGELRSQEAFKLVAPFLEQDELKTDASTAVAKIVLPRNKDDKGLESGPIAAALIKAIPNLTDPDMKKKAEAHLNQMQN